MFNLLKKKEKIMFDAIIKGIKSECGLAHFGSIMTQAHELIALFETNYFTDNSARNAALDSLVQYLTSLKK